VVQLPADVRSPCDEPFSWSLLALHIFVKGRMPRSCLASNPVGWWPTLLFSFLIYDDECWPSVLFRNSSHLADTEFSLRPIPQNACKEVERAIAGECKDLLPKIRAATPREISGIVSASFLDWTPRLKRHGSKVCKQLKSAQKVVQNGNVLLETDPDYPRVVLKFFTKVLTALVGTSSEHRKLLSELRKVRKDSRRESSYSQAHGGLSGGYGGTAPREPYRDSRDGPRQSSRSGAPSSSSSAHGVMGALRRHFGNTRLPYGCCWCCEYLKYKATSDRHSARDCPHLREAEKSLRAKGLLN